MRKRHNVKQLEAGIGFTLYMTAYYLFSLIPSYQHDLSSTVVVMSSIPLIFLVIVLFLRRHPGIQVIRFGTRGAFISIAGFLSHFAAIVPVSTSFFAALSSVLLSVGSIMMLAAWIATLATMETPRQWLSILLIAYGIASIIRLVFIACPSIVVECVCPIFFILSFLLLLRVPSSAFVELQTSFVQPGYIRRLADHGFLEVGAVTIGAVIVDGFTRVFASSQNASSFVVDTVPLLAVAPACLILLALWTRRKVLLRSEKNSVIVL